VDIIMFGEDLGIQNQTMLSPAMFRQRIKPLLTKMVKTIKSRTKAKIAMHTCGSVYAFIEDFIDIGVDVLNPMQSNARDMEAPKIKAKAGNKLALWGGIDTHVVMPKGTPEDVRQEVKRKIALYGKGGGYMLSPDHNVLVDVPPKNLMAMFEAAIAYGKY
jgi:uroporphyrinogen decarboxylase